MILSKSVKNRVSGLPDIIPNRIFVTFFTDSYVSVEDIIKRNGGIVLKNEAHGKHASVEIPSDDYDAAIVINNLLQEPLVDSIDYERVFDRNDLLYSVTNYYDNVLPETHIDKIWHHKRIGTHEAHRITKGSDAIIAIVDSGCDWEHNSQTNWSYGKTVDGSVIENRQGQSGSMDHGSSCASQAIGRHGTNGGHGVAPLATLQVLKNIGGDEYGGGVTTSDVAAGISELLNFTTKPTVSSNSWGNKEAQFGTTLINNMRSNMNTLINDYDVTFIFAAANNGVNPDPTWICPALGKPHGDFLVPGGFLSEGSNILVVGATDMFDAPAPYTNFGPSEWIHICAPGHDTFCGYSYHQVYDLSDNSLLEDLYDAGAAWYDRADYPDQWGMFGGTSSSTPIVAGVVTLVRSANPSYNNAERISCLLSTTTRSRGNNRPVRFWTDGRLTDSDFWHINSIDGSYYEMFGQYGIGIVDAEKAVKKARSEYLDDGTIFPFLKIWGDGVIHRADANDKQIYIDSNSDNINFNFGGYSNTDITRLILLCDGETLHDSDINKGDYTSGLCNDVYLNINGAGRDFTKLELQVYTISSAVTETFGNISLIDVIIDMGELVGTIANGDETITLSVSGINFNPTAVCVEELPTGFYDELDYMNAQVLQNTNDIRIEGDTRAPKVLLRSETLNGGFNDATIPKNITIDSLLFEGPKTFKIKAEFLELYNIKSPFITIYKLRNNKEIIPRVKTGDIRPVYQKRTGEENYVNRPLYQPRYP
jgi:subtilisin family serine protease